MQALRFDVSVPGFLAARSLGRVWDSARFGRLSRLRLTEVEEPELPGPDWVRLEVLACGICGTDLGNLSFSSSPAMEPFGSFPAVLGHEILAKVVEVGSGAGAGRDPGNPRETVGRFEPGQRVVVDPMISCTVRGYAPAAHCPSCREGRHSTCEFAGEEGELEVDGHPLSHGLTMGYHRDLPGGWGERMIAHRSQLFPVDGALSDRAAVLVEPLSIGMHAVLNAPPRPDDDVFVIGSGPIAMGVIWALRATGFRGSIHAQVKRKHEAALARRMGATDAVKPGLEAREVLVETGALAYQPIIGDEVFSGGGFPVVYDCVGNRGSLAQGLRYTAPRGRLVMLGCAAEIPKLDLTFLWAREIELRGFVGYGVEDWEGRRRHTFEITLELLARTTAPVEELVTHAFPLSEYREALSAASNHRRSGAVKVILKP